MKIRTGSKEQLLKMSANCLNFSIMVFQKGTIFRALCWGYMVWIIYVLYFWLIYFYRHTLRFQCQKRMLFAITKSESFHQIGQEWLRSEIKGNFNNNFSRNETSYWLKLTNFTEYFHRTFLLNSFYTEIVCINK